MKSSTLIVWLLVAACIAVDLAMIGELQVRRNEWPEAGGVVGLGLVFSQIALVALWTVCGRNHILVRCVSALLGVLALSCFANYSETGGRGEIGQWFGVLLVYCGACLVPFIIARFTNCELSSKAAAQPHTAQRHSPSNQFTIWGLLSLMTAVGIALAVARFAEFPMQQLAEVVVFFTLLATAACTILLLALFLSKLRYAVIATIAICPIVGVLLSFTELARDGGRLELTLMMSVQGVASLSAAAVLRIAGYRLVRDAGVGDARASELSAVSESGSAGQADGP